MNKKFAIRSIKQKNNTTFSIQWTDGSFKDYALFDLQQNCPCAGCNENIPKVNPDVRATKIESVGRYALKVYFTSGCSHGIYDFDFLYQLKNGA